MTPVLRSSTQSTSARSYSPAMTRSATSVAHVARRGRSSTPARRRSRRARARGGLPCASAPRRPPGRPTRRGSRPTARPSCRVHGRRGRARELGRGSGEVPGLVTELIRRNEEDAHALRVVMRSRAPSVVATLPLVFDACARGVRGGAAQDRAAPHQGGIAPGGRVLGRRHGVGDRGPLPAHGVPAAPGNGGVWARHLSLAPRRFDLASGARSTRSPTTPAASTSTIDGDDVLVSRATRRRHGGAPPSPAGARARGRPHARDRQVGPRPARGRRGTGRDRAGRPRLRYPLPRARAGDRASRCSSRWRTCSRTLDRARPRARAHPRARLRVPRHARATRRGSRSTRSTPASIVERLGEWYRRFVETRSSDAAERALTTAVATAIAAGDNLADIEAMMFAAVTDHVFIDGGHTLDFTNKAFEMLGLGRHRPGACRAADAGARRPRARHASEETGEWRHPHDLVGAGASRDRAAARRVGARASARRGAYGDGDDRRPRVGAAGRRSRSGGRRAARRDGAGRNRGAARPRAWRSRRRSASCGSTRRTTTATGTSSTTRSPLPTRCTRHWRATRHPSCCGASCTGRCACYLDRFLNVPAARLPSRSTRRARRPRRVLGQSRVA